MTETDNVATYARIRPYNPAINEDKKLTARCLGGNKVLNQNGNNEDTYNFTRVYGMGDNTDDLFHTGMKPLLDYKILQGINSIFIVYGQSGSGKSFTLIGEPGHLGVLPMSLQYLLQQDTVQKIDMASIEAYGVKATKIGFYDLVHQLKEKQKAPKKFDAYLSKDNPRVNSGNAQFMEITQKNCLSAISELQEVSHMAPTLKNPHSSRGHTVYFARVVMTGLEDVYFIAVDLAGSEGQTALGSKDEFTNGLKLAMSKGKLKLNKKQMKSFETMYKTRSLEAGCINNGLTQLQSIFRELIKRKISKAQGLGLRKILSSFITLKSAYAILFTLSASANNNKVTRATLNFAKQTQLVKVDTVKAKKKIDKDAIIKELNGLIEQLKSELGEKNKAVQELNKEITDLKAKTQQTGGGGGMVIVVDKAIDEKEENKEDDNASDTSSTASAEKDLLMLSVLDRMKTIHKLIDEAEEEEKKWTVELDLSNTLSLPTAHSNPHASHQTMSEQEMKTVFDEFDEDGGGTIDAEEMYKALHKMGQVHDMEQVLKLIEDVDENGDGEVDFGEFKVMVGQSWFISAFENKLRAGLERMMSTMAIAQEEDDADEDEKESAQEKQKQIEQELIEEVNEQSQKIQEMQVSMNQVTDQNEIYEKEVEQLKKAIEQLRKKNTDLNKNVDRLRDDNETLLSSGGGGFMMMESLGSSREIIHIQIGQCGNHIGAAFWTAMNQEHKLNESGKFVGQPTMNKADGDRLVLDKIGVYYQEASFMRFTPRACLIDLEPSIMDIIKASAIGPMFKPDNVMCGSSGTGNNWAKGHYTEGAELIDEAMDLVRRETEGCDCPQGFQMTHSLGGGTGSGLGTLLLLKIRDEYPDRITATFSVYPSPKVSDVVVEPYNATLSIHQLLENSDQTIVIDNEALFKISHSVLKQKDPKYADLNWVISQVMSGCTASLRFSGKLNGDLRKMGVNLVPFPRLHFFLVAQAPLFAPGEGDKVKVTVQELTDQMWSNRNFLAKVKSEDGKYLSAAANYRGAQIATQEVDDEIAKIQQKLAEDFVTWIPNNIKSSIINVAPSDTAMCGTFVANTTAIKGVFQRISNQFSKLFKRKAFLHWYKGEGMDDMEFQEADKNIRDLITEYQDKQDVVIDLEDDEDDEDEDEDDYEEDAEIFFALV
eukprot:230190_1